MKPSVSVLTAVRNGARYIGDMLSSIRSQTFEDWEHIIVDDASSDETPDLLARVARTEPRIRLIRRERSAGAAAALNHGLHEAAGRYVVLIDADDVAQPERISLQRLFLEEHPELHACAGGWQEIDEGGALIGDVRHPPSATSRSLSWALPVVSGVVHSSLCIRRRVLVELGGYRQQLSIAYDYGLWLDLARSGWLGVMPEMTVRYRKHPGGISRDVEATRAECLRVLGPHMRALTGEPWGAEEIDALWSIGRWHPIDLGSGLDVLDRWERAWRVDPSLPAKDRGVLRRLGARLRLRHIKWNRGSKRIAAASGLARWVRIQLEHPRARTAQAAGEPPESARAQ